MDNYKGKESLSRVVKNLYMIGQMRIFNKQQIAFTLHSMGINGMEIRILLR